MRLIYFFLFSLYLAASGNAQIPIYLTDNAAVKIEIDHPLQTFEAQSNHETCLFLSNTGQIRWRITPMHFMFSGISQIEEKIQYQYFEVREYPVWAFSGNITNHSDIDFAAEGTYTVTLSGKMGIHSVVKDFTTTGTLKVSEGSIQLNTEYNIVLADYNINFPKATEMKFQIEAHMSEWKK